MTLVDHGRRTDVVDDDARVPPDRPHSPHLRRARGRAAALVAIAVVVVALLGAALAHRDTTSPRQSSSPGAVLATRDQLLTLAATEGHSLYWAGEQGRTTFETTVVGRDVYLRYLADPSEVGSAQRRLTVGTYERTDAYQAVADLAAVPGATTRALRGGALVVAPAGSTSAYFAFRGTDLLMEVYDPTPGRAFTLVTSGAVQPIEAAPDATTRP